MKITINYRTVEKSSRINDTFDADESCQAVVRSLNDGQHLPEKFKRIFELRYPGMGDDSVEHQAYSAYQFIQKCVDTEQVFDTCTPDEDGEPGIYRFIYSETDRRCNDELCIVVILTEEEKPILGNIFTDRLWTEGSSVIRTQETR